MFLNVNNDGYRLDANHDDPIEADDLPDLVSAFHKREEMWSEWVSRDPDVTWQENWWFADSAAIEAKGWNLSAARYRPESKDLVQHSNPLRLAEGLRNEIMSILNSIDELTNEYKSLAS